MTALRPPAADAALILGGGLMGLAIAHQLARRDHPVCVISRRRGEAAGFVAAGMLAPHAEGLSGIQLRFGQLSLSVPSWVAQIEADSGLPCGLRSTGLWCRSPPARTGITTPQHALEQCPEPPATGAGSTGHRHNLAGRPAVRARRPDRQSPPVDALPESAQRGVQFLEGVEVLELLQSDAQRIGARIRDAEGTVTERNSAIAVLCSEPGAASSCLSCRFFP